MAEVACYRRSKTGTLVVVVVVVVVAMVPNLPRKMTSGEGGTHHKSSQGRKRDAGAPGRFFVQDVFSVQDGVFCFVYSRPVRRRLSSIVIHCPRPAHVPGSAR